MSHEERTFYTAGDNQLPFSMVATRSTTRRMFGESTSKRSQTGDAKPEALLTKSSNVDASTASPETPPILQLPVELFLIIVECVLDGDQPNFTICKTRDWNSLISLPEAFPSFRSQSVCCHVSSSIKIRLGYPRLAQCPGILAHVEINLSPSGV